MKSDHVTGACPFTVRRFAAPAGPGAPVERWQGAIGVSNFKTEHLQALLERSTVVPAVNQIELHPYFTQQATLETYGGPIPEA